MFLLTTRNRGEEGKGGYRHREYISTIDVGDDSEGCRESQRDSFKYFYFYFIIQSYDKNISNRERGYSLAK